MYCARITSVVFAGTKASASLRSLHPTVSPLFELAVEQNYCQIEFLFKKRSSDLQDYMLNNAYCKYELKQFLWSCPGEHRWTH